MTEAYRGHHIEDRCLGDGITLACIVEHGDWLVGGVGSFGSEEAARHDIDGCVDVRRRSYCMMQTEEK